MLKNCETLKKVKILHCSLLTCLYIRNDKDANHHQREQCSCRDIQYIVVNDDGSKVSKLDQNAKFPFQTVFDIS